MANKDQQVYIPTHLSELLTLYANNPDAGLIAGGTTVTLEPDNYTSLIDLSQVAELVRLRRTERHIEIGPALSFSRLTNISRHAIPQILTNAFGEMSSVTVGNLATIGGSICMASPYSEVLTALFALDAQIELKRSSSTRWLPINQFIPEPGKTVLTGSEVLTRIRVPLEDWNVQIFRKIKGRVNKPLLIFCGVARLSKGVVQDLRFSVGAVSSMVFRNRSVETPLIGRKLPLRPRDWSYLDSELRSKIVPIEPAGSEYPMSTVVRMVLWFLDELNQVHIYR